ncbi:hypothetical protein [Fictibacillus sp. JL2B1089]|uniref:hypothetical protein n=1 Tax=Fictibacillus sp. JL2B1089 TaxID=3399565 RepID=UPI003A893FB4
MKEKSVRMFPYGGYDPFTTPTAKGYANSQTVPGRPPYAPAAQAPAMPQQQYSQGFPQQPFMPYMMPMMPPGGMPHPMMQGMPFNQQQTQGSQSSMGMMPNNQGSGLNFGKMMGGANQVMGLAQQMGNILSFFK